MAGPSSISSQDEFEVFEDGVEQKVDTFTRVTRGSGIGMRGGSAGTAENTPEESSLPAGRAAVDARPVEATTALVFDHLSSEALWPGAESHAHLRADERRVRRSRWAFSPRIRVFASCRRYTTDRAAIREASNASAIGHVRGRAEEPSDATS